jgi:hypothetical protein
VGMIKNLIHVCSVYGTVRQQQLRTDGDMRVIPSVPHLRPRRKRLMGRRRGSKGAGVVLRSTSGQDRSGVVTRFALHLGGCLLLLPRACLHRPPFSFASTLESIRGGDPSRTCKSSLTWWCGCGLSRNELGEVAD